MIEIQNFYDLTAWKMAHELVLRIYKITRTFPKEEQFGITSQLRRAVSSISANVAEGFGRYHYKDKCKFYYQARASTAETQNFLLLVRDLCFITATECKDLMDKTDEVSKMLNGLIRSLDNLQTKI